jgi:hypothetical protein
MVLRILNGDFPGQVQTAGGMRREWPAARHFVRMARKESLLLRKIDTNGIKARDTWETDVLSEGRHDPERALTWRMGHV